MPTATITPRQLAATVVVAASNSKETWRASWDDTTGQYLICGGIDDSAILNAALAAAAGGCLVLLDGTYLSLADLTVPANTLVKGQGDSTIVTFSGAAITSGFTLNGANITIEDLKATLAAGAGDVGTRPNVIYANSYDNLLLKNLSISGDNSVADDGAATRQNGICLIECDDCQVLSCNITANKRNGVYLGTCTRCIIEDNNIYSNIDNGILLASTSNYCRIEGNTCRANDDGIYLSSSDQAIIAANTCFANLSDGIVLDTSSFNTVTGNNVSSQTDGRGIYVTTTEDNIISINNINSNGVGGTKYSGIYVESSDRNSITGNICEGNGLHGIFIFRSDYCSITGNTCTESLTGDGINVEGDATGNADYNTLTGNVCTLNAGDGIDIEGGANANKNIALGNQLLGNTTNPLVDNGANTEAAHNIVA